MSKIDLSIYNLRTDLIIEDENLHHQEQKIDNLTITSTKKEGNYITITFDDITDHDNQEIITKNLTNIIKNILTLNKIKDTDSALIIGLGNELSTPDSLGVKTVKKVMVTAHLYEVTTVSNKIRKVYAFNPGVMANTGIESAKIITSIIKEIKPNFVIAIDALAGRNIERINKTIQITDTGIHPGSGVGNNRKEISKKTMGIPVIAIGVPTVVMSSVIVYDTINYLIKHISYLKDNESVGKLTYLKTNYINKIKDKSLSNEDKENLLGLFGGLEDSEKLSLINEVLNNTKLNMIVTPTEIDFLIEKISKTIAKSIDNALHRQIN